MEQCTVWDSETQVSTSVKTHFLSCQVYVTRKKSREEPEVTNENIKRTEGEEVVGDQPVKTEATVGVSSLEGEEEEEGRVAGFFLQGKKVISTGFTSRQVFVLVP